MKSKGVRHLGLYLTVALALAWTWMDTGVTAPNERSRIYLAVSLVDHGTVSIDPAVERFGPVQDLAGHEGRAYTDKAPGASLLAAGAYGVARLVADAEAWRIDELLHLTRHGLMIPVTLLGLWFLRSLLFGLGVGRRVVDLTSVGWILGSAAFHYGHAFYGHQIVATALLGSLTLLLRAEGTEDRARRQRFVFGAGAAAGLAGLVEYQAIPTAALLLGYVALGPLRGSWRSAAAFVAGGAPFAAILLAYHAVAFGGPFELPYHHLASAAVQDLHDEGIGGVTLPTAQAIQGSLLSLHRGLLATSPLFLFALPGLVVLARRGRMSLAALLGLCFAAWLLFVWSASAWYAGWSFGPRLLVPVMGLAAIPVAAWADAHRRSPVRMGLLCGAVLAGAATHLLVGITFPEPPPTARNPLFDFAWPALAEGHLMPSLGAAWLGLDGLAAAAPPVLAVGGLLFFLCGRMLRDQAGRGRLVATLAALAVVATLAGAIATRGPTWSPEERRDFAAWLAEMAEDS